MSSPGQALQNYLAVHSVATRAPTRFAIKAIDKSLYIHSDCDSSGLSVVLAPIDHRDTWDNPDEAEAFKRRCAERYPDTPMAVVPC